MYPDEELLALSGIQHFSFCRRQWALIHIGQRWQENYLTASGQVAHQRAHDDEVRERRGSLLTVRGLFVKSSELGLAGICDVVEFRQDEKGIPLHGESGTWAPIPIEYKRGAAKGSPCDRLQVCAQAMCLEEMLGCDIASGFLFYKQTQSRELVDLDDELRCEVSESAAEMHQLFKRGSIPKARKGKACRACSLIDECLPALQPRSALSYINSTLGECDVSSSKKNTNGSGAS